MKRNICARVLQRNAKGAVRNAVGIRDVVFPGQHEVIVSGGKVDWLISWLCGEGLPTVHLAHADVSRGEQRPEHHRGGVGRRQHGLGFDPPLELLVQPLGRVGRA
jgi:hypothetical protein